MDYEGNEEMKMLEILAVIGTIIGFAILFWVRAQLKNPRVFRKMVRQDNGMLLFLMYLAIGAVGLIIAGVSISCLYEVGGGPIS